MTNRAWVKSLKLREEIPPPRLGTLDDLVLTILATGDVEEDRPSDRFNRRAESSSVLSVPKVQRPEYILITRRIAGYGSAPWTLVQQFRREDVEAPTVRLFTTAIVGFMILVVSVGLALWLGRGMTRRIGQLADAAESLRTLDFANAPNVPDKPPA